MNRVVTSIFLLGLCPSCGVVEYPQERFRSNNDSMVGMRFHSNMLTYYEYDKIEIGGGKIKYILVRGDCKYYLVVDKGGKIESWGYLSEPQKCKEEIGWFGPW